MTNLEAYNDILVDRVERKIENYFSNNGPEHTLNMLKRVYLTKGTVYNFQQYYFGVINERKHFLSATNFFRTFKSKYSLQGVDTTYLDRLEQEKNRILKLIDEDNITELYRQFFNQATIRHGSGYRKKDLGSFCAKLIHTFSPNRYPPLDKPIVVYFSLAKESFFFAFLVIAKAYSNWLALNSDVVHQLPKQLHAADIQGHFNYQNISGMKLLDMIFWAEANNA